MISSDSQIRKPRKVSGGAYSFNNHRSNIHLQFTLQKFCSQEGSVPNKVKLPQFHEPETTRQQRIEQIRKNAIQAKSDASTNNSRTTQLIVAHKKEQMGSQADFSEQAFKDFLDKRTKLVNSFDGRAGS